MIPAVGITALEWVNTVRANMGDAALDELAPAAPKDPSSGRRSRLAQSLPGLRTYLIGGGRVYGITDDEKLAAALQLAGSSVASAPGGGTAYGYYVDRKTKRMGFEVWLPRMSEDEAGT